jgi:alkylation response protein AidB-like acyl-CoA dehydrogenase
VEERRARAGQADDHDRRGDHLVGDPRVPLPAVHQPEPLDQQADDRLRRRLRSRRVEARIIVQRREQDVEGLRERDVAEVVEPGVGGGGLHHRGAAQRHAGQYKTSRYLVYGSGGMFAETEDQQLFEGATRRFLEAHHPVGQARALAAGETSFDPACWRDAAQLGWSTLLVPEGAGGGSISGNGLADLLIVAFEFGQHAAPGPLFGTNAVAAALGQWGSSEQQAGPLKELLTGDAVAAWAHTSAGGPLGTRRPSVAATPAAGTVVLDGRAGNVEGAAGARYLLVTAGHPAGRTQYLVPLDAPGVQLSPLRGVDLARRFSEVSLRDVVLPAGAQVGAHGAADEHDAHLLDVIAVIALGEIVGAVERAFAMTAEWTANRYSFGRPLNSYQEIKHRMADMRAQLEASEAVASRAAFAVGTGAPDAREWASAGMAYVGRQGPEAIQDCIQLHGGIGVTYDHDLHVFLRRATLDANLFGTPGDFAQRLGALVATTEGARA